MASWGFWKEAMTTMQTDIETRELFSVVRLSDDTVPFNHSVPWSSEIS